GLPGAAVGGVGAAGNALVGGVARGMSQSADLLRSSNSNDYSRRMLGVSNATQSQIAGKNKELADFATKGNYEQAIAAIEAKTQDLMMTPPSMIGQYGGETHQLVHDGLLVSLRWKMINRGALTRVGEHWLQYGYNLHRWIVPPAGLKCMTKFSYWKFQ